MHVKFRCSRAITKIGYRENERKTFRRVQILFRSHCTLRVHFDRE